MRKPRPWQFKDQDWQESEAQALVREVGLTPVTARVCLARGLRDLEEVKRYFNPRLESLTHPLKIKDMDLAVQRLFAAQSSGELVRVFGDYDVDGTSGGALLYRVFTELGLRVEVTQPDRFRDGYGLNPGAVEQASADGVGILVTIDCGITSFEAAERAQELGLDLIVVDHHQVDADRGVPPAVAVLNPQRPDCESGLKELCGCGVGFYLCMALRGRWRDEGLPTPNLKKHLDLVVMATAADQVPLVRDNRVLVHHGMQVLKQTEKPGVKALMEVAGLASRQVSPGHLGFALGPRINASGRMGSAASAMEALTTDDAARAFELAQSLERLNKERQELQHGIWDEVREQIKEELRHGHHKHAIVVAGEGWHEGVVGIVATRVTEAFRKPAIVIALREDFGKGSVRSWGGKNVLEGLRKCSDYLLGFGGHKAAAGLSLDLDKVSEFRGAFDEAVGELEGEADPPLLIEEEVDLTRLDVETLKQLEAMAPFGPGNPEPVFVVCGAPLGVRVLKDRHYKFKLGSMEAIWFHGTEHQEVETGLKGSYKWAGVPELNRFRGRVTPTFRIKDIKPLKS